MSRLVDRNLVEDIYPLSPMQLGMMFHTLREPGSGVYVEQIRLSLEGLDPVVFRTAWERMMSRHAALRTSIVGTGRKQPAQVVRREVDLPWREHDCRQLTGPGQLDAWLDEFMATDGAAGFALDEPCLVRFDLVATGETNYEFIWTLHHIVLDGWSGSLVLRDALRTYHALLGNTEPQLPEVRPFRQFIEWVHAQDGARSESYWRKTFAGLPPYSPLPGDRLREASADATAAGETEGIHNYGREELQLPAATLEALRKRAASAHVTLNTLLQGAWALTLARAAGVDEMVVGTVTSGRPEALAGVEDMVGMFVNTLPLRIATPADEPLDSWLAGIQARQAEQREFDSSPLWQVQKWSGRPTGQPLFENLFVFENYPVDRDALSSGDGLSVSVTAPFDRTGYPLMLLATPANGLHLQLTHDAERFPPAVAQRVLRHVVRLLDSMGQPGNASLGELTLLTESERDQLVQQWNQTTTPYPTDRLLHNLVQDQAAKTPDATALISDTQRVAYSDLIARAHRLAHHLRELGVGPDHTVGICHERSPEMIVAVLGVLAAGGAYVPLAPDHPADRLETLLADAGISVVVGHEATRPMLEELCGRGPAPRTLVCQDRDRELLMRHPSVAPDVEQTGEQLAYVLFTSGSTGKPKGVAMPHGPLVNLMHWQHEQSAAAGSEGVTLQFSPLVFDVSCQEIFATLGTGGALVLIDDATRRDPSAMLKVARSHGVTRLFMPFVALQQLAVEAVAGDCVPESLREVITAGEQLVVSPALMAFFQRIPDARLVNQYGPTEAHVVSSHTLEGTPDSWPRLPSIGKPIANSRLYILDGRLRPVPVGVSGELCIGGTPVARGYLGDADASTAERFVPDPYGTAPGARMYRTGDRARFLEDGSIEYLGRSDNQVKLRGFRVELGEVEAVAASLEGVDQAVAVIREDRPGDHRLALYYVTAADGPTADQVRDGLRSRLPDEMVPSGFRRVDTLPKTGTGKVDRQALLTTDYAPTELRSTYVPPRGPTEQMLAELWSEVLGVDLPSTHDDFFDLGGHSLTATQLMSRVREALRVDLPLRALFDHPTIAQLAAAVGKGATDEAAAVELVAQPRTGDQPLSFSQQRLWFLDQIGTDAAYNMPWAFRLTGTLDADALERSLAAIVARHDSLRTRFLSVGGSPVQRVEPELNIPLRRIDLSGLDETSRQAELQRLANLEAETPFDLEHGPLFRPSLIRLGETEHVLFLSLHHIIFDGWSIGVLNRELLELYRADRAGETPVLPELTVKYVDFVDWQSRWFQGAVLDQQLAYWTDKLGGKLPVLELPTDRPRPELQTYRGAGHVVNIDPAAVRALSILSRRQGVTLAVTVMAAFKVLLSRTTGQDDILLGTPIANRTQKQIEDLIGFFVNTLVLRTDLSGDPTFLELLGRVHTTALDAYENQDLPFERLVDELQPERDPSRNPIFQVVFAMQNATRDPLRLTDLEVTPLGAGTRATRFDLELHVGETAAGLDFGFCYNRDLFDHDTIERLGEHFRALLTGIAENPAQPISHLPMLLESERRTILEEWNDTSRGFPVDSCLHEAFAAQAAQTPDALAVTCDGESLTYRELDERSNQLAHVLRDQGVGPEVMVGLCLDRNLNLPVGILGVLKAGGGYVPLDLANPTDRIAFILRDTAVSVLVTEAEQLDKLPGHEAQVVCLDRAEDRARIDAASREAPEATATPDNLAYVIFTSGSTGEPKGVLVEHRSVRRLFDASQETYQFCANDVWTQFHSSAFDFSVWELWGALLHGGRLVLVPYMVSRSPDEFLELLSKEKVTVLNQTPSAFRSLIGADERAGGSNPLSLRFVIFGGEALDMGALAPWFERHGDEQPQLVNMYGITETTVHVTRRRIRAADLKSTPGSMLGRPLPDLTLYVLDGRGEPAPIGVPGEMYVGGAGVARGYLRRPELTAERFVPDPFRTEPGARLYRTGDVGRMLPDGDIQYVGRNDEQVKLRGYRIELGEIEAALTSHPWVASSVVTLLTDKDDDSRLVGYVVPAASETDADAGELVSQWATLYDDTYSDEEQMPDEEDDFNIVGWNSSYTMEPLPAEEMREWVDATVAGILEAAPKRVLEIGCGTGLLLFRVAPKVEHYLGTDFSSAAIDYVGSHLPDELKDKVALRQCVADRLPEVLDASEAASYDAVILNSVLQYFPSTSYLVTVLEAAVAATAPGGRVHVGDVRHLGLLEAYHASVQLHQADRDLPLDDLAGRFLQRLAQEEELVVDPALFLALREHLPRVHRVEITPKRGDALNELTAFRYQVTLHVGEAADAGVTSEPVHADDELWWDWQEVGESLESLVHRLKTETPETLGFRNVPNARSLRHAAVGTALRGVRGGTRTDDTGTTADQLRRKLAERFEGQGVTPQELFALEESLPYTVRLDWSRPTQDGSFDVLLTRNDAASPRSFRVPTPQRLPWEDYGNHPLQARLTRQLAPRLRDALEQSLPTYMVPSAFVMLEALPLTANGKVNRKALPDPDWFLSTHEGESISARNDIEQRLTDIWTELLGVDQVSVDDNFFDLGGHSLLAAQMVSRIRDGFSVELGLRQLFDSPTIEELGQCIEELAATTDDRETGEL